MRHRLAGLACVVLLLLLAGSGCGSSAADGPRTGHPGTSGRQPAEYAGGACQLMNFDLVNGALGGSFDIAGAGDIDDTYTCVLQRLNGTLPDLTLAVTPTLADTSIFRDKVVPKGATVLSDLGKLGYSRSLPASGGAGPGAEVGWLSGNQRLMVLRYRSATGTATGDANAIMPKLVTLAKKVDQASV